MNTNPIPHLPSADGSETALASAGQLPRHGVSNAQGSIRNRRKNALLLVMLTTTLTLFACVASSTPLYDVVEIEHFEITDMNDSGRVVGDHFGRGASWENGNLFEYTLYSGFVGQNRARTLAINNGGMVAGFVEGKTNVSAAYRALLAAKFVGDASNNASIPVAITGVVSPVTHTAQSQILALNESNIGVGTATDGVNHHRAAIFDINQNTVTDICGALNLECNLGGALDINETGLIAGGISLNPHTSTNYQVGGFLYQNGANVFSALSPVTGAYASSANAVNDAGFAVGASTMSGSNKFAPTLWKADGTSAITGTVIGGLPAWATFATAMDINNSNQVLINAINESDGYSKHVLLADQGNVYELENLINPNDPLAGTVRFERSAAINNNGWIAVNGRESASDHWNGYLLKPVTATPPPPPPPPAAAQLTTGSPVSLSQSVTTASTAFSFDFDFLFTTPTGELEIRLGDILLDKLFAPGTLAGGFQTHTLTVNDAGLLGRSNLALSFILDGPTGSSILLDNIDFPGIVNPDFQTGDLNGWTVVASPHGSARVVDPGVALASVPAPPTLLLMGLGLIGFVLATRIQPANSQDKFNA